jgi:acyl-[acyl carrier protein]--UDP-N-acetylglucosamine O-acyltransferase
MRFVVAALVAVSLSSSVFAQQQVMRSSNPSGVQIQGNTSIAARNESVAAASVGQSNESKNTSGAIKGGVQIQGNTTINASQKNAAAVTVGRENKATNQAGVIGGN